MTQARRLFVIPARDRPIAAIIARGPSAWAQLLAWDLQTDEITAGAWFKGRIYEDKCDLSPDGELLVYACHGGRTRPGYTHAWTAVSRLPWLHALALWPHGTTYGGGGRFTGPRTLALRSSDQPHPDHLPAGLTVVPASPPCQVSSGEMDGADWSGRDHENRLIYAVDGCLFRMTGGRDQQIADLNDPQPAPAPAPAWATAPITAGRRRRS